MRTHHLFEPLQPWRNPATLAALVKPEHFVALRVEPVMRNREPAAVLDLHFDDGLAHAVLPLVLLDVAKCADGDGDPLVFPSIAAAVDDAVVVGLIEIVLEALLPAALRRGPWKEQLIALGDARRVQAARERGWFGAAPLERSVPPVAPAIYARRFAGRRAALTYGPQAAALAAFLTGAAVEVSAADAEADALAWYGVAAGVPAAVDLAVGDGPPPVSASFVVRTDVLAPAAISAALPLPLDVLATFDPLDGPPATTFAVASSAEPLLRPRADPPPAIVGGSAGRIALVVRPDAGRVPDADTDEAFALADGLRAEGFEVSVTSSLDDLAEAQPDLVHLFGVVPGAFAEGVARWALERGLPLAVHAYEEDALDGGYWGASATAHCFSYASDDRTVAAHLALLSARRVEVDGISAAVPHAPAAVDRHAGEAVLRAAAAVFAGSEREAAALRGLGLAAEIAVVPPVVRPPRGADPIGAAVGDAPFALVLAPIRPHANQLIAVRAAETARVRLVLAGAIEDRRYAELLRARLSTDALLLPEPTPDQAEALLRAARVVIDASWVGRGQSRLAAAALSGAALAVAHTRWTGLDLPAAWRFDPADVEGAGRALGQTWDAAIARDPAVERLRSNAAAEQRRSIAAVLDGYAKLASSGRRPAAFP